jgi:DNA-directed RNA polymerase specialized sigma24 family protein
MTDIWTPNQDEFNQLLLWLDADPETAGSKYEEIRASLIRLFQCRGCDHPEGLADETIDRVMKKIQGIAQEFQGEPRWYFHRVAQFVQQESRRRNVPLPLPDRFDLPAPAGDNCEEEYECLEQCLGLLALRNRDLIIQYYKEDGQAKIECRRQLAVQLSIPIRAMRLKVHRIRETLYRCVISCVDANHVDSVYDN